MGHSSLDGLLTSTKLTGAPQPPSAPRRAYQMSSPPIPPARFDAKYRMSSRWATNGQPSRAALFRSPLVPAIDSAAMAGDQAPKPLAAANATVAHANAVAAAGPARGGG